MSMNKQRMDPRVIRTHQMLRNALIHLIQEKGFDEIKVKDITDYATLNKATFYLHYRDKEDLVIKSTYEMLQELDAAIGLPTLPQQQLTPQFLFPLLITVFKHFEANADFYRVILNQIGTPPVFAAIQTLIGGIARRWLTSLQGKRAQPVVNQEILIQFVSHGSIGLLQGWLNQRKPDTPEYMAYQFLNILVLGVFRSAGLGDEDNFLHDLAQLKIER
jgi:AcrR family transcriptional regulator